MVLVLSETDIAGIMSMRDGVRVVEEALAQHYLGGGVVLPRTSVDVPGDGGAFRVIDVIVTEAPRFTQ